MNIKKFLYLIALLFTGNIGLAQSGQWFTTDGYLSGSAFNDIKEDVAGNIWIATDNGLTRYDGAKWKHYQHTDSLSLMSDMATCLMPLKDGRMLVGTTLGMQIYDPHDDLFHLIKLIQDDNKEESLYVSAILYINDTTTLASTLGHGLFNVNLQKMIGHKANSKDTKNNFVTHLMRDANGNIWAGINRRGCGQVIFGENEINIIPDNKYPETTVTALWSDDIGNIYIATEGKLYLKRAHSKDYQLITDADGYTIRNIIQISDTTALLGIDGYGLKTLSLADGKIENFKCAQSPVPTSDGSVYSMLRDINDNIWIGFMKRGILALPSKSSLFDFIPIPSDSKVASKKFTGIDAIQIDDIDNLWVAVQLDGIYNIDENGKILRHFPANVNGMPDNIRKLFFTSNGRLWIGSATTGLGWLDIHTGIFHQSNDIKTVPVYDIIEDANGNLWIATMGKGIYKTDKDGNLLYCSPLTDTAHYSPLNDMINNSWINSITLTDAGKLYINTCYGLGCYDIEADSYLNTFGTNRVLAGNLIRNSILDSSGILWIATMSGLYRCTPEGTNIIKLTVKDGLPSNSIMNIIQANPHQLWITTNYGICSLDTKTLEIS